MPRASTSPDTRRGLKVSTVVKSYSGTVVLNGVSLTVAPGEVVGLVGHNGAGKSTLMRCISGATRPDAGSVEVDGQSVRPGETSASIGAGIATVYQELSLLPNLTVAENVFLGDEIRRGGLRAKQLMHRATQALLKEFDLDLDPQVEVSQIPVAARQLLEVAIATRRQARYILLDEPSTRLGGDQVDRFLESVRGLAARGLGIVLVDHKLEELYAVCDRIVALVDGAVRIDAAVAEVPREDVVEAIAGDADAMLSHDRAADESRSVPMAVRSAEASVMVRTRHLRTNTLADVSLLAARGRILGIYGLVGAGRTELLHALIGLEPVVSGELELDGRRYRPRGPHDAMKHRVVYVTEERKADGIIPQLDSVKNLMLSVLRSHQRFGLLGHRALARVADEHMNALRVRGARQNPKIGRASCREREGGAEGGED